MKKQAFQRGLLGFPLGIALGHVIAIVISLIAANGRYFASAPALADALGSEVGAAAFQSALCGLLGTVCAAASVIWERCDWSIVKQTGIYFLIAAAGVFPIAWFSYWMEHSLSGFLSYAALFVAIFVFIWMAQFLVWKRKIRAINKKMGGK